MLVIYPFCRVEKRLPVRYKMNHMKQDAQLSQRCRAAACDSFGQRWNSGIERQYFTDIIRLSSTTVT